MDLKLTKIIFDKIIKYVYNKYMKIIRKNMLFIIVVIFISCNNSQNIINKKYEYEKIIFGTHRFTFEINLENIGKSKKKYNLIKDLIYNGKNFDEYIEYKEKYFIGDIKEVNYPVIIDEDGTKYYYQSDLIENYSIIYHNDSYVIIKYDIYFYHSGAVHGNYLIKYFIIDLFEERILNINDLINQIPDDLLKEIIEKYYTIYYYLREDIWPPDTVNINNGIVELIWNTYSITPYSIGFIQIEIPNEIIRQYLTNKGKELIMINEK
jgi:hypothetical protein